jgi:hypothetical protein
MLAWEHAARVEIPQGGYSRIAEKFVIDSRSRSEHLILHLQSEM